MLAHDETTRILVCAPSNRYANFPGLSKGFTTDKVYSAADVFVKELSRSLTTNELFRLCAFHRKGVPVELRAYSCYVEESDVFNIPPLEVLLTYRVVVSTMYISPTPPLQPTHGE